MPQDVSSRMNFCLGIDLERALVVTKPDDTVVFTVCADMLQLMCLQHTHSTLVKEDPTATGGVALAALSLQTDKVAHRQ